MQTAATGISTGADSTGTYWTWRGLSVYYVRVGQPHPDRPPLLLVHGFGASTDHWRKNIQGLSLDFEVWAIDLLGFGRSIKGALDYGAILWRDQLQDFIAEVIGRPAVLAGNSLGGYAALTLGSSAPRVGGRANFAKSGRAIHRQPDQQPDRQA